MNIKLSGIVGKPEQRYTPEGKAVLTFSLGMYTSVGVYYRDGKPLKRKPRDS